MSMSIMSIILIMSITKIMTRRKAEPCWKSQNLWRKKYNCREGRKETWTRDGLHSARQEWKAALQKREILHLQYWPTRNVRENWTWLSNQMHGLQSPVRVKICWRNWEKNLPKRFAVSWWCWQEEGQQTTLEAHRRKARRSDVNPNVFTLQNGGRAVFSSAQRRKADEGVRIAHLDPDTRRNSKDQFLQVPTSSNQFMVPVRGAGM